MAFSSSVHSLKVLVKSTAECTTPKFCTKLKSSWRERELETSKQCLAPLFQKKTFLILTLEVFLESSPGYQCIPLASLSLLSSVIYSKMPSPFLSLPFLKDSGWQKVSKVLPWGKNILESTVLIGAKC